MACLEGDELNSRFIIIRGQKGATKRGSDWMRRRQVCDVCCGGELEEASGGRSNNCAAEDKYVLSVNEADTTRLEEEGGNAPRRA